jgi:hypothetical protein
MIPAVLSEIKNFTSHDSGLINITTEHIPQKAMPVYNAIGA